MSDTEQRTHGTAEDAGPSIDHAREELKQEGRRLYEETKAEAQQFATEKKGDAATFLRDVGEAVSAASGAMGQKGHGRVASYGGLAAGEVGNLADHIEGRELDELLDEVTQFARRRPALFYGASLLAGFAAIRFLKARAEEEAPTRRGPGGTTVRG